MQSAVLTLFKSHHKNKFYFTIIHNNMILDNNKTHPWTPTPLHPQTTTTTKNNKKEYQLTHRIMKTIN